MVCWSQTLTTRSCTELIHPGTSCLMAPFYLLKILFPGLIKFFAVMYLAQHFFSKKPLTREEVVKRLTNFIHSVLFGLAFAISIPSTLCIQWNLMGKVTYVNPTFLSGLLFLLNTNYRKPVETFAFTVMALETMIRAGASNGYLPRSNRSGTLAFMISNGLIFYLMWKKLNKNENYSINWLLKPSKKKDNDASTVCYHRGPCWIEAIMTAQKYILVGLMFSAVKLYSKVKSGNFLGLLEFRNFKLAAFFAAYVLSFKCVNCGLNNYYGRERAIHAALAGFIAGLSYTIRPTISLPITALILLVMCGWERFKENTNVPKLPYTDIIFMISSGVLIHCLISHHRYMPRFFIWMFMKATGGSLNAGLHELWKVHDLISGNKK